MSTSRRAAARAAAGWTGSAIWIAWRPSSRTTQDGSTPTSTVCLEYLSAAEVVENGLEPADVSGHRPGQIPTVHAAKGLEWQVVAVPHLSGGVFPSTASKRTWSDAGDLPRCFAGGRSCGHRIHWCAGTDVSAVGDRKALSASIIAHRDQLERRRIGEERRLLYVAITRAEDTLLLSATI